MLLVEYVYIIAVLRSYAAYCYRRSSVVCLSVCHDRETAKMAETIAMPFGLWTKVDQGTTY